MPALVPDSIVLTWGFGLKVTFRGGFVCDILGDGIRGVLSVAGDAMATSLLASCNAVVAFRRNFTDRPSALIEQAAVVRYRR